jgi:hypothetical protein
MASVPRQRPFNVLLGPDHHETLERFIADTPGIVGKGQAIRALIEREEQSQRQQRALLLASLTPAAQP